MAFNPLSSFRKYPKIWMSGVLLLCMLTFVFERFFSGNLPGFMQKRGDPYLKVNERSYYYNDIEELKEHRNIANDFMRTLADVAIRQIDKRVNSIPAKDQEKPEIKKNVALFIKAQDDLFQKVSRESRYFHGGTKMNDLIEFILWRDLADKYGVYLTDDDVRKLVDRDVHAGVWGFNEYVSREVQSKVRYNNRNADDAAIMQSLRDEFRVRIVQIAMVGRLSGGPMLATEGGLIPEREFFARPNIGLYMHVPMQVRVPLSPEQLFNYYRKTRTELDIDMLKVSLEKVAEQIKLPEDSGKRLATLKEFYEKNKTNPYNPNLEKPGFLFPAQTQVQFLTANADMDYYKQTAHALALVQQAPPVAFNPLQPLAGLLGELSARAAWEKSMQAGYEAELKANTEKFDRFVQTLKKYQTDLLSLSDKVEDNLKKAQIQRQIDAVLAGGWGGFKYTVSPWTTPYYWNATLYQKALVEKPAPTNVAALVGACLAPDGGTGAWAIYHADAYAEQLKTLQPMVRADLGRRGAFGAEMILHGLQTAALGGQPFTAAIWPYYAAKVKASYMPVAGFVEEDLRSTVEKNMARQWMNAAMLDAKAELEGVKGRAPDRFRERLDSVLDKYRRTGVSPSGIAVSGLASGSLPRTISGLQLGSTEKLRNEFDIDLDENLKVLRDSFDTSRGKINTIEGRGGKPDMLKQGDFYKLFFSADPIGLGSRDIYDPVVWPPYVTPQKTVKDLVSGNKAGVTRLFDEDAQPILYWKTDKRGPAVLRWDPNNSEFMALVEKQYKMQEARNLIMKKVEELAKELKKVQSIEGQDVRTKMRDLAKQYGFEIVTLPKVAQLVENPYRGSTKEEVATYEMYSLPRGRIPFAREDMVKQLLALNNQTMPVKIGVKDLDDLNDYLFLAKLSDKEKQVVKQIQVLTNKPRSDYYIAVMASKQEPTTAFFYDEIFRNALSMGRQQNRFIDQAQEEYAKQFMADLVRQLRRDGNVWLSENAEKHDAESSSGSQQ